MSDLTAKILAFAGSEREGSYNKMILKIAAEEAGRTGATVTLIDLKNYPLPLYNADFEEKNGLPENAKKLKKLFLENNGLLLACPEYNSSITPLLKNTLDWVSRPEGSEIYLSCYKNKIAALISTSTGNLGGLRGLVTVRAMLENIGVIVLPEQISIINAIEAFDENGNLKDANRQEAIRKIGANLTKFLLSLNC